MTDSPIRHLNQVELARRWSLSHRTLERWRWDPNGFFSEGHYQHLSQTYPDLVRMIAGKRIVFVDSITDLTRQAMAWARTRPEAFSEKTGKPDPRGAYGLLAREVTLAA